MPSQVILLMLVSTAYTGESLTVKARPGFDAAVPLPAGHPDRGRWAVLQREHIWGTTCTHSAPAEVPSLARGQHPHHQSCSAGARCAAQGAHPGGDSGSSWLLPLHLQVSACCGLSWTVWHPRDLTCNVAAGFCSCIV